MKGSRMSVAVAITLFACVSLVVAQGDIVPTKDILGSTSVFMLRGSAKSVSQKFATQARATRSKQQRADTARRVKTQYATLAKAVPRRTRSTTVAPEAIPADISTMPAAEASVLFAGVGEYYMDRDNYDQAIDVFREALTLDSGNARARMGLSEALAFKGNELLAADSLALAEKFFSEALTYNDRNAPAYFGLAEINSDGGEVDIATENYERALQVDAALTEIYLPLAILYYQRGNIAKADELLKKAVAINAADSQAQYYTGLVRLQQPGRDADAAAALMRAKNIDTANAEIFYYSGEANSRLGKNVDALEDFKKATLLRPNYFEAWFGLGSIYFELENYTEAIKALEEAKKLRNTNAEVVANLGDAYRLVENYNQARSNYNLATVFYERRPEFQNDATLRNQTADAYGRVAFTFVQQCAIDMAKAIPCDWNVAINALESASKISDASIDHGNLGWAYYNAATIDARAGRTADARAKLEKARDNLVRAIEANPAQLEGPLLNLSMVYKQLGDHNGAITTLNRVVERAPKWTFAINELGMAYYNNRNYKDAVAQFNKVIARDGNDADAYYNLGMAHFRNNNLGEARKAHARLRALDRHDLANKLEKNSDGAVKR